MFWVNTLVKWVNIAENYFLIIINEKQQRYLLKIKNLVCTDLE